MSIGNWWIWGVDSMKTYKHSTWKWMVGTLSRFLLGFGRAFFQGRAVSFRECTWFEILHPSQPTGIKQCKCMVNTLVEVWGIFPKHSALFGLAISWPLNWGGLFLFLEKSLQWPIQQEFPYGSWCLAPPGSNMETIQWWFPNSESPMFLGGNFQVNHVSFTLWEGNKNPMWQWVFVISPALRLKNDNFSPVLVMFIPGTFFFEYRSYIDLCNLMYLFVCIYLFILQKRLKVGCMHCHFLKSPRPQVTCKQKMGWDGMRSCQIWGKWAVMKTLVGCFI